MYLYTPGNGTDSRLWLLGSLNQFYQFYFLLLYSKISLIYGFLFDMETLGFPPKYSGVGVSEVHPHFRHA